MSAVIAKPEATTALAKLLEHYHPTALAAVDDISRAFAVAEGVRAVREVVKVDIDKILPLQGSSLGFRTDKDKQGGYPKDVVIECVTEALLRGLRLTGNEWNIIGGRCYVAQAGCARLVGDYPGLTDLELAPSVPVMKDGGAIVEYAAGWNLDGKPMTMTRKIPVRVDQYTSMDSILGKAKRKMLAAIYERLTGSVLSEGDSEDVVPMKAAPTAPPPKAKSPVEVAVNRIKSAADLDALRILWEALWNEHKWTTDETKQLVSVKEDHKRVLSQNPEAPEGEDSADPSATVTNSTSAESAGSSSANASATEPAPLTMPAAERRTEAPRVGGELVGVLLKLMHSVDVNWTQIRDRAPGKGAEIAEACGIVGTPSMKVNELTAPTALALRTELQRRVDAKEEAARKRGAKKVEVEA